MKDKCELYVQGGIYKEGFCPRGTRPGGGVYLKWFVQGGLSQQKMPSIECPRGICPRGVGVEMQASTLAVVHWSETT
jgi:hypothetical protein